MKHTFAIFMPFIREAQNKDRDEIHKIFWKAFNVFGEIEEVPYWNRPEDKNWAYVAVEDNKPVATVSFSHFGNTIRGVELPIAGVWGVATEPQYRRRGFVRALMETSFKRMKDEGLVYSVLDPFYTPFYEKFGYATAELFTRHVLTPSLLPHIDSNLELSVRQVNEDYDLEELVEVQTSMQRFGSRIYHPTRWLKTYVKKNHFYVILDDSDPVAMVRFSFQKLSSRKRKLNVDTVAYVEDRYVIALLNLIKNYAATAHEIDIACDPEFPIRFFLSDNDDMISKTEGRMMTRIIDFEGFCTCIKVPKTANSGVVIRLKDNNCPWNSGKYELIPTDGKLEIQRTDKEHDILLNDSELSHVVAGIYSATQLHSLQVIECSSKVAKKLESIFPADPLFSYPRF